MRRSRIQLAVFAFLLLGPFAVGTAYAYLDPGSGSMLVQFLIGVVAGGAIAIGMFWRRVVAFFKRLFSRRQDGDPGRH